MIKINGITLPYWMFQPEAPIIALISLVIIVLLCIWLSRVNKPFLFWSILAIGCCIILSVGMSGIQIINYAHTIKTNQIEQIDYSKFTVSRYALIDKTIGMNIKEGSHDIDITNNSITMKPFENRWMIIHDYTGEDYNDLE